MPSMEDEVYFRKNVEKVVDTEQEHWKTTEEDEGSNKTKDDDGINYSPTLGDHENCHNRKIPDAARETNESPGYFSSGHRRKTSPVQIDTAACRDSNSLCATESSSLPSPLPSHFASQDDLLQQEPRRKTIAFFSASNRSLDQKPEEHGNIKYTSLKSEMRKRSKTEASKKVNGLGLITLGRRATVSDPQGKTTLKKEDDNHWSSMGIHEEVFESSCMGDWIVTDLDLNVYEMKQAQDVMYLREKRKQKRFSTIFGLRRCWFI